MKTVAGRKEEVLETLRQIREDAAEVDARIRNIGTREVELCDLSDPVDRAALRELREEGKVERSTGWVWISEVEFRAERGRDGADRSESGRISESV